MKKKLKSVKASAGKGIAKLRRKKGDPVEAAKVPYITNDSIAEHREEVLKGARKHILPLQHSRRRVITLSIIILSITVFGFLAYSLLGLYKFQNTSTFMYRITQVIPFPVARARGSFVSYESYLFELRHYMHYYETQQKLSFDSNEGRAQLAEFKKQAMDQVVNDAYIKYLAKQNGISVTNLEVDQEIAIVRQQNRLGTSDQVFEDVLRDFWGWSVGDFKRSLRQQILARKVASKLDTEAQSRAEAAYNELQNGTDFAEVVKKYSDDESTKESGGDYGLAIDQSSRDIPAKVTNAIFSLQTNQYSGIIDSGYSLEIVRLLSLDNGKARAAHIQVNLKSIDEYIGNQRESSPPRHFLKV
jgi:parvulin-like peptidyl-prolyl isomerase